MAIGLGLAGCSGLHLLDRPAQGAGAAHTPACERITPQAALQKITLGSSTRQELAAALGQAIVIHFDSGYEVWVYRWPGADRTPRAATELVVLFDPAGHAAKARLRPGYGPGDAP